VRPHHPRGRRRRSRRGEPRGGARRLRAAGSGRLAGVSRPGSGSRSARDRRRRARRYAVRLQNLQHRRQTGVLRRLLGPSSWRCHPHAAPHPGPEPHD